MRHRSDERNGSARAVNAGPHNLIEEFIGNKLVVLECSAESFRGASGKIVDETKNTLVIESGGREKRIPKKGSVFDIGGKVVRGDQIRFRAEDRPRKLKKKIR